MGDDKDRLLGPFPGSWRTNVVTVRLPATVAFDFDAMTKVNKDILSRLGCDACYSGFDIRYIIQRDFIVDPAGKVAENFGFR